MVLAVEPAGNGDIEIIIEIPSDPNVVVPQGAVCFLVTVTLASTGSTVATRTVMVDDYRYGDNVVVGVANLVIGEDYVFSVSASNTVGTSETADTMPIVVEGENTVVCE